MKHNLALYINDNNIVGWYSANENSPMRSIKHIDSS